MTSFVDTHCHGIPGVDDGVQSDEAALLLLRHAVESQIRLVFMTPHVIKDGRFFPDKQLLNKKMKELPRLIEAHDLPIEIKLGCEIMITRDSLAMIQDASYWGYQDTDYVLIEFMPPIDEILIQEALYELKRQKKRVIIAHPERYFSDPTEAVKRVRKWKEAGAYLQLNKTSLFISKKASNRKNALALIENNLIHTLATDAHHAPGRRECRLMDGYLELKRIFGSETADLLCSINPTKLALNEPLQEPILSQTMTARLTRRWHALRNPSP